MTARTREWKHASGFLVRHCQHPTAIWPYYLVHPRWPMREIMSLNGRGFKTLKAALQAVEFVVAGRARVTSKNCVPGVACIPNVNAFGEIEGGGQ